ncbi:MULTISPECIES: hypothetical protein [unclassified Streptomyces]|uniref:hypothetical protein n=1 Tax=unclassified Streptomyces TaxID=2593676 RepID=UPI0036E0F6A5
MTPRLRTTGRPLPLPLALLLPLWPLLFLALLLGPATSGTYAYAAEPAPTRAPASGDDETPAGSDAGSDPGAGRTHPGRAESDPAGRVRPGPSAPTERPREQQSEAGPSVPHIAKPSASASPGRTSASHSHPKASPADPSHKGHPARKSHSARTNHSASASAAAPKRFHRPSRDPSRTRPAHESIPVPVPPEEPQVRDDEPDGQEVQPSARPTGVPVDNADRTPRQAVAEPVIPAVTILPLGFGLVLVGLGVGFLALRLRRP